jgi:hypothetical protein
MTLPLTVPDLVCVDDLDPNGNETKTDLETYAQDVFHQLIELPGSNPDDPDGGIGADQYLSGTIDQISKLPGIVENVLERDDRCDGCSCNIIDADPATNTPLVVDIKIAVDGKVLGLQYGWIQGSGLVPMVPVSP